VEKERREFTAEVAEEPQRERRMGSLVAAVLFAGVLPRSLHCEPANCAASPVGMTKREKRDPRTRAEAYAPRSEGKKTPRPTLKKRGWGTRREEGSLALLGMTDV